MGLNACCGFSFGDEFLVLQLKSGGEPPQSRRSAKFSAMSGSREASGLRCLSTAFRRPPLFVLSAQTGFCQSARINPDAEPPPPETFSLPSVRLVDLKSQLPPKDWPHAPVHRLADSAVYFVTASTLHKTHLFNSPQKRDLLERLLLSFAKEYGWQLEAWAVFANHYHIVARGKPDSRNIGEFLHHLHGVSSHDLNQLDGVKDRQVWFNFRDTRLTIQHSYLARLN
jgi:putative transposase